MLERNCNGVWQKFKKCREEGEAEVGRGSILSINSDAEGQRAIAIHRRPEFLLLPHYSSVNKERIKYGPWPVMNLNFW